MRCVDNLLLFTVVPSLMSFWVTNYRYFFSRPNFEISNFGLKNLHEGEIFEKEDILHFNRKNPENAIMQNSHIFPDHISQTTFSQNHMTLSARFSSSLTQQKFVLRR